MSGSRNYGSVVINNNRINPSGFVTVNIETTVSQFTENYLYNSGAAHCKETAITLFFTDLLPILL